MNHRCQGGYDMQGESYYAVKCHAYVFDVELPVNVGVKDSGPWDRPYGIDFGAERQKYVNNSS